VEVRGSGVYTLQLTNTNVLTRLSFSARAHHEPLACRRHQALRAELAARRAELATLDRQVAELEKSEEALALRLWEVQETRRRHAAVRGQLVDAVQAAASALGDAGTGGSA
jgi:hypothetical protein